MTTALSCPDRSIGTRGLKHDQKSGKVGDLHLPLRALSHSSSPHGDLCFRLTRLVPGNRRTHPMPKGPRRLQGEGGCSPGHPLGPVITLTIFRATPWLAERGVLHQPALIIGRVNQPAFWLGAKLLFLKSQPVADVGLSVIDVIMVACIHQPLRVPRGCDRAVYSLSGTDPRGSGVVGWIPLEFFGLGVVGEVLGDPHGRSLDGNADTELVEIRVGHVGVVAGAGGEAGEGDLNRL